EPIERVETHLATHLRSHVLGPTTPRHGLRAAADQVVWAAARMRDWAVSLSRRRDPSIAINTANPPAAPANANAAAAPALGARAPPRAAPAAARVEEAVTSHENASVWVPAGAVRSTIP